MDNYKILLETLEKENVLLIENCKNKCEELQKKCEEEKQRNQKLMEEKEKIESELNSILYSRSYKFVQKIKKIFWRNK